MRAVAAGAARSPGLPAQALGVGLVLWLLADEAGYPLSRWGPAAVVAVAGLACALAALPAPRPSRPVVVALLALGGHVLWSYASIAWASVPGEAWTGANRELLVLVAFALLALWPVAGRAAALLVAAVVCVVGALGALVWARLAGGAPEGAFVVTRLRAPSGYPNANAALWMTAVWPALALAAARPAPWWARAALGALAVALLELVLLCQSRGALLALPVVLVAAFALGPARVRLLVVVAVVGAAAGAAGPAVLGVAEAIDAARGVPTAASVAPALDEALRATLLGALAAGAVLGAWGVAERLRPPTPAAARRWHRAGAAAGAAAALALVAGGVAVAGDPAERARDAWRSFKGGYSEAGFASGRLTSGLGSDRYDFYRVALRAFAEDPVRGAGTDQFRERYLREGLGDETPRYPHSLELRALSQGGLVGTALLALGLGAALAGGIAAVRRRALPGEVRLHGAPRGSEGAAGDAWRRHAAAGAVLAFAAWLVHGSADWFAEIAGLAAAALALLGLACAAGAPPPARRGAPLARRRVEVAATAVWALLLLAVVALPWLADRDLARAGAVLGSDPPRALALLDRAVALDPLGASAPLAEGTARLRLGDPAGADAAFRRALRRAPRDHYATLARGAIASARGDRRRALVLLRRARRLAPRDDVTRAALRAARQGRVDLVALQRALLGRAAF